MQVILFKPVETWIINVICWIIFHLGIGYSCSKIAIDKILLNSWLYKTFAWENNGTIYQNIFRVRSWKRFIPQGSAIYPGAFSLQHLKSIDPAYLDRWLRESIRAEYCHWMMILPGFAFFLWNDVAGGVWVMVYALVTNIVPIILQRYNRPRIRRLIEMYQKEKNLLTKSPFLFQGNMVSAKG